MSWVAVGVSAAGAIKGGMDANANRRRAKEHDKFRKAAIQYSPWSGMGDPGAGNFGTTDMLSGALGGGLQGYSMGSTIKGMGANVNTPAQLPEDTNMVAMNYQSQAPQQIGGAKSPWSTMQQNNPYSLQKQIDFTA